MVARKQAKLILVGLGVIFLSACQGQMSMWVAPGSTADHLVFGWSTERGSDEKIQPEEITVYPCDTIRRQSNGSYYPSADRAVWAASSPYNKLLAPTNRVTYGQGFAEGSAKPLTTPGCYVVMGYAKDSRGYTEVATMGFKIASDGVATDMPRSDYENLFR